MALLDEKIEQSEVELKKADDELVHIGALTAEQAREEIMTRAREEAVLETEQLTRSVVAQARMNAEAKARDVIATAIERYAGEVTADSVVAVVDLSLIHISEPTRPSHISRMPSSA